MERPPIKLVLIAHGHVAYSYLGNARHYSPPFQLPPNITIFYYGEFGKGCITDMRGAADSICRCEPFEYRMANFRAERDPEKYGYQLPEGITQCNEPGCQGIVGNSKQLRGHVELAHVPMFNYNDLRLRLPGINRGYYAYKAGEGEKENVQLYCSPLLKHVNKHPAGALFPDLALRPDKDIESTITICTARGRLLLLDLKKIIDLKGGFKTGSYSKFPYGRHRPGTSRLHLSDIVAYVHATFPGETIKLHIVCCLDGIPGEIIQMCEESKERVLREQHAAKLLSLRHSMPGASVYSGANRLAGANSLAGTKRKRSNSNANAGAGAGPGPGAGANAGPEPGPGAGANAGPEPGARANNNGNNARRNTKKRRF
jgi:hypothetical protein